MPDFCSNFRLRPLLKKKNGNRYLLKRHKLFGFDIFIIIPQVTPGNFCVIGKGIVASKPQFFRINVTGAIPKADTHYGYLIDGSNDCSRYFSPAASTKTTFIWRLDLGSERCVETVGIKYQGLESSHLVVVVENEARKKTECDRTSSKFDCKQRLGRYVHVLYKDDIPASFKLCEVEVEAKYLVLEYERK